MIDEERFPTAEERWPRQGKVANIVPESNLGGDRIYQNLHGTMELVNKNGTLYKGKIDKRSIKLSDGSLSYVHLTADNRWFDRAGIPISKPSNLIVREKNDQA
jgi:hypothetical protein